MAQNSSCFDQNIPQRKSGVLCQASQACFENVPQILLFLSSYHITNKSLINTDYSNDKITWRECNISRSIRRSINAVKIDFLILKNFGKDFSAYLYELF